MFTATEVMWIKKQIYADAAHLVAPLQLWQYKRRRAVSLTLIYWRYQHRCCATGGKDTQRKENALSLQTPHRTSTAANS